LQLTQFGNKDEDEPAWQFPVWPETGVQQHTPPQFIPQGSGRRRKVVTSIGAARVTEKANSSQPAQNPFLTNAMTDFGVAMIPL
jgi:hypothetical protein